MIKRALIVLFFMVLGNAVGFGGVWAWCEIAFPDDIVDFRTGGHFWHGASLGIFAGTVYGIPMGAVLGFVVGLLVANRKK